MNEAQALAADFIAQDSQELAAVRLQMGRAVMLGCYYTAGQLANKERAILARIARNQAFINR